MSIEGKLVFFKHHLWATEPRALRAAFSPLLNPFKGQRANLEGMHLRSHDSSLAELEFAVRQAGPRVPAVYSFFWEVWRISAVPELLGHSSVL